MFRRIVIIAAMSLMTTAAFAQSNKGADGGFSPCYLGFVEAGFGAGQFNGAAADYGYRQWVSEIATTHGVQLARDWFVGAGASWFRAYDVKENFIPVYGAVRYTLSQVYVKPFAEARVGMIAHNSVRKENVNKLYLSGSLGVDLLSRHTSPTVPFGAVQIGGRLTLFGLNNDKTAFCASLYLALAFGGR